MTCLGALGKELGVDCGCLEPPATKTSKTRVVVVDLRRAGRQDHAPFHTNRTAVEKVSRVQYLGVHTDHNPTSTTNTWAVLQKLSSGSTPSTDSGNQALPTFYMGTVQSVLTYGSTSWFRRCSAQDQKRTHWSRQLEEPPVLMIEHPL